MSATAEGLVAILRQGVETLPTDGEAGQAELSPEDMAVITATANVFKTLIHELRLEAVNKPELLSPEVRVEALQCLATAMKAEPVVGDMEKLGYFLVLQIVAEETAGWEAGQSTLRSHILASRGFSMNISLCKLPGMERVAAHLLEGIAGSWRVLRAQTDAMKQHMALSGWADLGLKAAALLSMHLAFARTMATFLVRFQGMQGQAGIAALFQEGKMILLQAYQEAIEQTLLRGLDLDAHKRCKSFNYDDSMLCSMFLPVALHSVFGSDAALMQDVLNSSTAAFQAIPTESFSPTEVLWLPLRLRLLHAGCSLALSTRPQPPLASVAACLAAWRPFTTKRVCDSLSMSETAENSIKRLVARLEATKKAQEREAKATRGAGVQATGASSQAEADAAMRALLAEEEAAEQAAQRQAARKGRKKARQAAKKAAGERQEAAPQQQASSAVAPPGSRLQAPSTPVAHRLGGRPPQQDAAAEADVCTGSAPPSAVGSEQGSVPSHSRDLEHAPAGSQPQPPRELLDNPVAAEQDSLATQAASLALDPPRSPVATPAAPPARPRPRPPHRGGGQQALPSVCQPTAASSQAGGSSQQLLNRLQLEELCTCPITQELFVDPVIASDGFTYERAAIEAWIARKGVSPMTEAPLALSSLQPSIAASQMVAAFHSLSQ